MSQGTCGAELPSRGQKRQLDQARKGLIVSPGQRLPPAGYSQGTRWSWGTCLPTAAGGGVQREALARCVPASRPAPGDPREGGGSVSEGGTARPGLGSEGESWAARGGHDRPSFVQQ